MEPIMAEPLGRLRELIARRLPDAVPWRPPASEVDLARLADTLGFPVPAELAQLLRICDGQEDDGRRPGPLNFARFLSATEIARTHRMLSEAVGDLGEPQPQPAPHRWICWSTSWVPFLAFEGDTYCLDLDPGETGRNGQVFYRPNAPDLGQPLAGSLSEFLARVCDLIESGAAVIEHDTCTLLELYG